MQNHQYNQNSEGFPFYGIRRGERRKKISYGHTSRSATALKWVGDKTGIRLPFERNGCFYRGKPFKAAGKLYAGEEELRAIPVPGYGGAWYKDCYGRMVLYMEERFPCFDFYDYLNEDRYYRWFLICRGRRLTRIYMEDERPEIYVTEDVTYLEEECWRVIEKQKTMDFQVKI